MKVSRFLGTLVAASLAFAGAAAAADLPSREAAPAPAPAYAPPLFTWAGFYAGAHLGGAITNSSSVFDPTYNGVTLGLPKRNSVIGGVQVGYNAQWGSFVVGVEGDLSYLNYRSARRGVAASAFDTLYKVENGNVFATFRGRFGVAFDRALIYATGGVAYTDLKYSVRDALTVAPFGAATIAASGSRNFGGVFGAGIEYAFTNNWTAKAEYLYALFPRRRIIGQPGGNSFTFDKTDMHILRVGVNYKF